MKNILAVSSNQIIEHLHYHCNDAISSSWKMWIWYHDVLKNLIGMIVHHIEWYDCIAASSIIKNILSYCLISLSCDSDSISLYLLSVFISHIFMLLLRKNEFQHGWSEGRHGLLFSFSFPAGKVFFPCLFFCILASSEAKAFYSWSLSFILNEYISILSEKTSERIFKKKKVLKKKERKKPRAWVKLYNGFFS